MTATPTLADVVAALERRYPLGGAESWDAVGLVVGDPAQPVRRVLFAVDPVAVVADEAVAWGADLLVTHHPLFLRAVHSVAATTFKGAVAHTLVRGGVGLWAGHTNADAAAGYAYNPEALAEKVYGGRADLGNETPGDGWRYIGRGPIQISGRANYAAAEDGTGLPLLERPDLAETPSGGALVAGWFWRAHGLNELADADDAAAITKRINGGFVGLADRERQVARAKLIFR